MKKKINSAKKGMVLIFTTVILFIATSIVAVLSTFVIVARNQKIENEYISRTKIALKNKSHEIFSNILVKKFISYGTFDSARVITITTADFSTYNVEFDGTLEVKCYDNQYESNKGFYEYTIDYKNLVGFNSRELKEVGLVTTINFSKTGSVSNPSNYTIGEMRYF